MDSIGSLLGQKDFTEPPEIGVIREFIAKQFGETCKVQISEHLIIIIVPSSAFAGALRMHLPEIKRLSGTQKRLMIRIS